jgi:hypothetical protein
MEHDKIEAQNLLKVREMIYDSDEKIEANMKGQWIANNLKN